ncbi:hypothetical protein FACS189413_16180 [Bacteroidia bacterium]|nr:hypothetical protein FACS189413_16180 [Bacteroidia bacterium]
MKHNLFIILCLLSLSFNILGANVKNNSLIIKEGGVEFTFSPVFTLIYSPANPNLGAKSAGIKGVQYNVAVWNAFDTTQELKYTARKSDQFGDGFDDEILSKGKQPVTANLYAGGRNEVLTADKVTKKGELVSFEFPQSELGRLHAQIDLSEKYPVLSFSFMPAVAGYFSIGYTGAPAFEIAEIDELWQPLIWQEKRAPDNSYLTLAYRCPAPTTLVTYKGVSIGVVAHTKEMPFEPLPTATNSRFGVALRNKDGKMQPQIFAPALGGINSKMKANETFTFSANLYVKKNTLNKAFEQIGRELFNFRNYRHQEQVSLNTTLDNMVDYGMSKYSLFIDSLKGCNYSTDAPGAVKNVSSLNPLQISLLTGREDIFKQRAYPMVEYMLSREKFLFCIDPNQKIQSPSRLLKGPCAPISELVTLYLVTGKVNTFLLDLAIKEYNGVRTRNLDDKESGKTWEGAMQLYKATGDKQWLDAAISGADEYLAQRVNKPADGFNGSGYFFWTGYTPNYVSLLELYELTTEKRFLEAAHKSIRQYAMFIWFVPQIPDKNVVVNPEGWAPHYAYLQGKGYKRMEAPKAEVPAWRLSEIGLTSESSGTSTGHRGIFMTNFAPWMMRIGYLTNDNWLQDIARSAVIGRYANFPGYHINTDRTNVYESPEYPYRKYDELSVNSFHYNHIWPHTNILTDYLITDAYVKSEGAIDFPSQFVEGFAYLQSKLYGQQTGKIYHDTGVNLYLPQHLVDTGNKEINFLCGYTNDRFYVVLTNQSAEKQAANISVNKEYTLNLEGEHRVEVWKDNKKAGTAKLIDGRLKTNIAPNGITVLMIDGVTASSELRRQFENPAPSWKQAYQQDAGSGVVAMRLAMGSNLTTLFVYVNKDDTGYDSATLSYSIDGAKWEKLHKPDFPFEFTVPLDPAASSVKIVVEQFKNDGSIERSNEIVLFK